MSTVVSLEAEKSEQELPSVAANFRKRIESRTARIGVLGLGYVGLPLAMTFEKAGFSVIGMDLNSERVDALNNGSSYIAEVTSECLRSAIKTGRFVATADLDVIDDLYAVSICVPTPL